MIAEPKAVAFESGRRINQRDALPFDARLQPRQILGVAAERKMMQRLGLAAFHDRAPTVIVTKSFDGQRIAITPYVEAELAVEVLRHRSVGHRQHKLVERMHTKRIGFRGRRDIAANGGHYLLPWTPMGVIGRHISPEDDPGN